MITYESICKKLGFKFDSDNHYRPNVPYYEDDSVGNPYESLSEDELDFIAAFLRNKYNLKIA
ncbi:MAG: hypothetical protein LBL98_08200 [Ruminococcus sp.]|jgi:hypothetical protein|nr:hypothetical protein [Ruminococcus sp.]